MKKNESTFISPTKFISKESAQLACMLNYYYNYGRTDRKELYRSFFANSRYEVIQGTIKLMRHYGLASSRFKVAILDLTDELQFLINPLEKTCESDYLMPGVVMVNSIEDLKEDIDNSGDYVGVILRKNSGSIASEYSEMIRYCREKDILTAVEDSDYDLEENFFVHGLEDLPDVIILGESLSNYEVPFGVFSMRKEVHDLWANIQTCTLHSSTYASNSIAVSKVRNNLLNKIDAFKQDQKILKEIEEMNTDNSKVIDGYNTYINPGLIEFYSLIGYDFICKKAHGSRIEVEDRSGKQMILLDTVIGAGACSMGHTPDDIIENVINKYDKGIKYSEILEKKLGNLLSLQHCFPAVSGATAVENAIILSLLAAKGSKVIVFKGNYAGKTLVSIVGTGEEVLHQFLRPIYNNVVYIEPFSEDAEENLIKELEDDDTALVWFEMIQGTTVTELPQNIISIVQRYKEKKGYYIGVDEILMGFYRVDKLVSYTDTGIKPDVVTFSKALADATFPIGMTVVSEEIYNNAVKRNRGIVDFMKNLYKSELGCCIALNSIEKITNPEFVKNIQSVSEILEKGLKEVGRESDVLEEIRGKGHIYKIVYKDIQQSLVYSKKAIEEQNLFIYVDKILPPLSMTELEAEELIEGLRNLYK